MVLRKIILPSIPCVNSVGIPALASEASEASARQQRPRLFFTLRRQKWLGERHSVKWSNLEKSDTTSDIFCDFFLPHLETLSLCQPGPLHPLGSKPAGTKRPAKTYT